MILLFIFSLPIQAATFTVTNLDDNSPGSLRQAVLKANAATDTDTVEFQAGLTGTIALTTGQIEISAPLTINGPGAKILAVSGNRTSRVFYVTSAGVTLQGLTIKEGGNSSLNDNGGGIYNLGVLTLNHLILSGNTGVSGGAIYNRVVLTVTNLIVSGNEARESGGGIYNNGRLTVSSSTVSNNTAAYGGGIRNYGTLTVSNSTVSGNTAKQGGGMYDSSSLTMTNSTLSGNTAMNDGGGILLGGSDLTMNNTLVAGNAAPNAPEVYGSSRSFTYSGNNLFGKNGVSGVEGPTLTSTDLILTGSINTAIGPLADNGGPTQTHALVAGSPAIDAGNNNMVPANLVNDQRGEGFSRIVGGTVDIGAVEYDRVASPYLLTVNKTGGNGTVTSNPAGINCGSTCDANFGSGTLVTLSASPATGYSFSGWSGDCSGTSSSCTVTMDAAQEVTALFANVAPTTYSLTIARTGTGSGTLTVSGAGSYAAGATVTLTATPAAGSTFAGWSPSPCANSFAMPSNALTCTATFVANTPTTFAVTTAKTGTGSGTVNGSGNYAAGATVTLTATPAAGSTFAGWSPSPCANSFAMPSNALTCTATFVANAPTTFAVTTAKTGTGSGTVNGSGNYAAGTTVTLTATPAAGSTFAGWSPSPCAALFAMPANNLTCTATFNDDPDPSEPTTTLITHYYVSILRRDPDSAGLTYWQNLIAQKQAQGLDVKPVFRNMANFFFNGPEYLGRNTSNVEFITNLYLTFFQREPDSGGISFWLEKLATGMSRNDAMAGFLHSPEFTQFMSNLGF